MKQMYNKSQQTFKIRKILNTMPSFNFNQNIYPFSYYSIFNESLEFTLMQTKQHLNKVSLNFN